MTIHIKLSPNEKNALIPILMTISERVKHVITLPDLINGWSEFVTQVELCYDDSIYEYENDLSARDLLQEIIQKSPDSLSRKLINILEKMDERFKNATLRIDFSLKRINEAEWWWYRIPNVVSDELRGDLESLGLMP